MRSRVRRSVLILAMLALSTGVALVVGVIRLRIELQEKVDRIDASAMLDESGLGIRSFSYAWESSDFIWFPTPSLVLRGFSGRFHSGRPGPGEVSARLDVDELRIVSAWRRLFRGRVERIELNGGKLECAPDVFPDLPRFYNDFLDGTTRPVPWMELLNTLADSTSIATEPRDMRRPTLVVRDLEVHLLSWEILSGCTFAFQDARAVWSKEQWDFWAHVDALCHDSEVRSIPLRIRSHSGTARRIEAGRAVNGPALILETDSGGEWNLELDVVRGSLAQSFLMGRNGLAGRAYWSGPWRLTARGRGEAPAGLMSAHLDVGPGTLRLLDGKETLQTDVHGSLVLEPHMIKSPGLWLSSENAAEDSARIEFEVWKSSQGSHSKGIIEGILGLEWLRVLGPGWDGHGTATASLQFSGRINTDDERPQVHAEGDLRGEYSLLKLPWLNNHMVDGSFLILAQEGFWNLSLDGKMGLSPFELKVDDLAQHLPGGGLMSDAASRWSFSSTGGRLEDFAASAEYAGGTPGVPFWLALPGRGSARIAAGSSHGVPLDALLVRLRRNLSAVEVDTVDARLAGGWLRGGRRSSVASGDRPGYLPTADLYLEADSLDLALLLPALQSAGVDMHGRISGRLSGQVDVRWTPEVEWENAGIAYCGSIEVERGEVSDHPILDDLRSWAGIDGLRSIPFGRGEVRFTRSGDGVLIWEDLAIVSELLRLEGAGTVVGGDTLWAVLRAEVGLDNTWADLLRSALKPGSAAHLWIEGPAELPDVRVIGVAAYREARERISDRFIEASGRRQPSAPNR